MFGQYRLQLHQEPGLLVVDRAILLPFRCGQAGDKRPDHVLLQGSDNFFVGNAIEVGFRDSTCLCMQTQQPLPMCWVWS
jgi:hypothetical protein